MTRPVLSRVALGAILVCLGAQARAGEYVAADIGLHATFPEGWEQRAGAGGEQAPLVFFYAPPDSGADGFRENVNLIVRDVPPDTDFARLRESVVEAQQQLSAAPTNAKFEPPVEVHLMGGRGLTHVGSLTAQGRSIKLRQWFVIAGGKAYTLTYTALETTFEQYVKEATAIALSMKVETPTGDAPTTKPAMP